jgi:DNA-binding response OmpR family regulator/HAMP domain-containing protein
VRGDVETRDGTVRYLAVPVIFEGEAGGAFAVTQNLGQEQAEVDQAVQVAAGVSIAVLAFASLLAFLVAGRVLAPLNDLSQTARAITETDLTRRIDVSGDDELARTARTFNAMLDRIEAALDSQRAFVSDAGHELRTPITVIRGHLELLGEDPEERRETLALVDDELDRMSRLGRGSPDARQGRAARTSCATRRWTSTCSRRSCWPRRRSSRPRRWSVEALGTGRITADRQRLTQAVMNLAANAAQHTAPGDPIALGSAMHNGGADFWVRDEGPGIPAADQERIFERFARAGDGAGARTAPAWAWRSSTPSPTPTAGASICGRPGRRRHLHRPRPHDPTRGADSVNRILIAEDEERVAAFVEKGLRANGYTTTTVGDGPSAVALARDDDFDLLILDLGLPGLDGLSVLRTLRGPGPPAARAHPQRARRRRGQGGGLELGADDYVTKPFRFEELLARVRVRLRDEGTQEQTVLRVGGLSLDLRTRRATVDARQVELSAREFAMLEVFLRHHDQVLSREQLLSHVWGYQHDPESNVVDVYVGYLRKKVGRKRIATVRGMGYALQADGV